MTSTTVYERGQIALVRFVFADEQGAKRRPVLVLSTGAYQGGRAEIVVAALTSNTERLLPGDCLVGRWREAGLPKPSVVTAILRTIKVAMIERTLGTMDGHDLKVFSDRLRPLLGL